MNLNKVILIGRLAADPESRTIPSGQSVTTIRLATSRVWNNQSGEKQEQTEFHTIIAWGKLAEITSRYLRKGQLAMFEGRLQNRSWEGQDGVKRYKTEIVAENMQMGPKAGGAPSGSYEPRNTGTPAKNSQNQDNSPVKDDDIPVINEDEPFGSAENKPATKETASNDDIEEKEVDLKDIPF